MQLKRIIAITAGAFVILVIVLLVYFSNSNRLLDVNVSISPSGNYHVLVDNNRFETKGNVDLRLKSGKYELTIINNMFQQYKYTIEVKEDGQNSFDFNISNDKFRTGTIIGIGGLVDTTAKNYYIESIKMFRNNELGVISIINKNNPADRLLAIIVKQNGEWRLQSGPSVNIGQNQTAGLPSDAKLYLETFDNEALKDFE